MADTSKKTTNIGEAAEILLDFSIDRNDMKIILDSLPEDANIDRVKIEYEIQILKILSVGWSLTFFLEDSPEKQALTESFWLAVQEFSGNLSTASSLSLNTDYDYFAVLKKRLEVYVNALDDHPKTRDPASVIGPRFATACEAPDDAFVILSGSKMFNLAVLGVRHYLDSVTLVPR